MSPRLLLILAASMLACTNNNSTTVNNCDTLQEKKVLITNSPAPVAAEKIALKETSPELPFFKKVPDFKRLFW